MVDFVSTRIILPDDRIPPPVWNGETVAFDWQGLTFLPSENFAYRASKESLRKRGIGNMNAVIRNGMAGTLHLSNSLHKVAHNGANHTDFKFSELKETVDFISDIFELDFGQATLQGRIEFGVNIQMNEPHTFYHPNQIYKNRRPFPLHSKGKLYGGKFCLSSYEVKTYSPALKLALQRDNTYKISPDLFRFELVSKCWHLKQKGVKLNSTSDLLEKENLRKIKVILVDTAKHIKSMPHPPENLSIKDLEIWYFFQNATSEHLKHCRINQKDTYYRHKKRFDILLKDQKIEGRELAERIASKWDELMNS